MQNNVSLFADLVASISYDTEVAADVIPWCSPVPFFGKINQARVATVAINPSSAEFLTPEGSERSGAQRRLPSLNSLGLSSWGDADAMHLNMIETSCLNYFENAPYTQWFNKLEQLNRMLDCTYYATLPGIGKSYACHIDLVPFTTYSKWNELSTTRQKELIEYSLPFLCDAIIGSDVDTLILNGKAIVDVFSKSLGVSFSAERLTGITLKYDSREVQCWGYCGYLNEVAGRVLERQILVLGYNTNLQSSFGVSNDVLSGISDWLKRRRTAEAGG